MDENNPNIDEKPPFLKTWKRVYFMIVLFLISLICLFYFLTKYFS
jgi:Mg2+ and Co2+ transporter CorA